MASLRLFFSLLTFFGNVFGDLNFHQPAVFFPKGHLRGGVPTVGEVVLPFQVVLTKADKLRKGEAEAVLAQVRGALQKHPAAYPELVVTSSEKGEGIETLRAIIAGMA